MRAFGWVVAVLVVLYLGLLGVSLVGSPDVVPLSLPAIGQLLPGPGAPLIGTPLHVHRSSGELLATVPRTVVATTAAAQVAPAGPVTAGRSTTTASSGTPAVAPAPVATNAAAPGKSSTATTRNPTTTNPTTSTTSPQPRSSQTPAPSSKASTHSAHWRAYATSPSPAPTP